MEMMRRVAAGRLSEVLGDEFVETDKFQSCKVIQSNILNSDVKATRTLLDIFLVKGYL